MRTSLSVASVAVVSTSEGGPAGLTSFPRPWMTWKNCLSIRRRQTMTMTTKETEKNGAVPAGPGPVWAALVATFFGIGRLRPGPGTWGSAAALFIWIGVAYFVGPHSQPVVLATLAAVAVAVGIPAATTFARASGQKDPQSVVI